MQGPREGVVGGDLLGLAVEEEEASAVAVLDLPPRVGVFLVGQAGEEDVGAADGRGEIRVGAAADGREGGEVAAVGFEEESDERGRVERAEAAAEGRGGADGGEEGAAGERGADEAWERGEAEEDVEEEVVAEGVNGGDGGGLGLRRRRQPPPPPRGLLGGHGR